MSRYDYDSLTILAAVIREGSFEAAAKSMKVTQSAVSQRIKQLEEKVGVVLIARGRPCVPTEAGLQFFRHFEQVGLLQQELAGRMRALVGGEEGVAATVRIGVNNDSLATWFPKLIKLATKELGILFDILPDDQEYTESSLRSGDALAVITTLETPVQGCKIISLGSMEYVAVASPELYQTHFADGVSLEALRNCISVAFNRKDTIQDQWMTTCFGATVPLSIHYVPSYEGYLSCCLNGAGWGLVPSIAGNPFIERGELVELSPGQKVSIALHWQAAMQSSEILSRLGNLVLEVAREHLVPDSFRPN
ncbi:LysR family transcriptional regulator ArgP [Tabrizicola sp.]|uniref:LysR family transcriptional regulator ArgP n=1 Tax=Tabrizicola sp. TaxID=2005166 RepID=UPI002601D4E9|nr:LysR family transcriptional regulator ArgP [Tabrizicola sp.]MDM7932241.1 LysR family transcriptional regulator ArgP [Tabrizicola sp.]